MKAYIHITLLFSLLLGTASTSQAQDWILQGRVLELGGDETIPYANIMVQGTEKGVVSNENGRFRLELTGSKAVLVVTRIGYRRKLLTVKRTAPTQRYDIGLETSDVELDDVVISDGLQRVFEDPTLHLYDYEFSEDHLFVIVYDRKRRRSRIALVNANDSIISVTDGPEVPGKMYKDCLGNVHVVGKEYACQLFVVNGQIAMYKDPIATFKRVVMPCLASLDEFRYYKEGHGNDQMVHFYAHNVETKDLHALAIIKDKEKIHQMLDPLGPYVQFASTEAELMAIPPALWEKINKIDYEYQFNRLAFFYPVSAPMRILDERVVLFDHTNGQIHKLEKGGKHLSSTNITYHKAPRWQRSIYVDEIRQEAYASYLRNGYLTLSQIDLETGELMRSFELPRQFPMKVQVRDGVVFFMYKELDYDTTNRLYRLRIKD